MNSKLELKRKAVDLRKRGSSYKQIIDIIPVSKGTLSFWFKNLDLTDEELAKLREKALDGSKNGRIKASLANRERRMARESLANIEAEKKFNIYKDNPIFIIGVTLYWAEGSKRTGEFQFINSDPNMIVFMNTWINIFMPNNKVKYRLFTHKIFESENLEEFWAQKLKIGSLNFEKTIYKPTTHSIKKNPNYKGCLRISISGINSLRTIKAWQNLLIMYYSDKMHP